MRYPITPGTLAEIRAAFAPSSSGYVRTTFSKGGITYQSNGNPGWGQDATGAEPATGFYAYDAAHSQPGDVFSMYLMDGTWLGDEQFRDAGNGLDLLAMAVASAVAMYVFLPGLGAGAATGGGAGYGIVGGATEPVASISYAGAAGAAGAGAATTAAGTLSSAGGALSTIATTATKVLGAATAALGLQNAGAGPSAPRTVAPPPAAPGGGLLAGLSNIDTGTALFLAGALGLVAFVATRKG